MKEQVKIKGRLQVIKNGKIVVDVENLIVNYGLSLLAELLSGATVSVPEYIAAGTGNVSPTPTDIELDTEIIRAQATVVVGTGSNSNKITFSKYWPPNAFVGIVQEAGLFDASTAGNMFNRAIFTSVDISAVDTFAVVWTIEFSV